MEQTPCGVFYEKGDSIYSQLEEGCHGSANRSKLETVCPTCRYFKESGHTTALIHYFLITKIIPHVTLTVEEDKIL
jgi:hypothetical protein